MPFILVAEFLYTFPYIEVGAALVFCFLICVGIFMRFGDTRLYTVSSKIACLAITWNKEDCMTRPMHTIGDTLNDGIRTLSDALWSTSPINLWSHLERIIESPRPTAMNMVNAPA